MEQQQYYGGPASGVWCERCGRGGHEAKMCAAREPRRFNGLCDTCRWFGHLSFDCLLQRDRPYSTSQPFPLRRSKHLRHTAVAAAAPAMISRVIRHSKHPRHTAVAVAAPAMISLIIRRSSQPHAPSLALSETRGTTAATVQRRHSI